MQPYYEHAGITIYHTRCEDVLPALADIDLILTSPPYNMGLVPGGGGRGMYKPGANSKGGRFRNGYGQHTDAMPIEKYNEWQRDVLQLCWASLSAQGAIYYNHRGRVEHGRLRFPLDLDFGLTIHQMITWDRGTGIDVNLRQYCSVAEWIFVFAQSGYKLVSHSASGFGDVWRLGMEYAETGHPAPFPVSLPLRAIVTTGARTVVDPFMGSGSTLVAAKQAGRSAIGIEIEEAYCECAAQRLQQEPMNLRPIEAAAQEVLPLEVA